MPRTTKVSSRDGEELPVLVVHPTKSGNPLEARDCLNPPQAPRSNITLVSNPLALNKKKRSSYKDFEDFQNYRYVELFDDERLQFYVIPDGLTENIELPQAGTIPTAQDELLPSAEYYRSSMVPAYSSKLSERHVTTLSSKELQAIDGCSYVGQDLATPSWSEVELPVGAHGYSGTGLSTSVPGYFEIIPPTSTPTYSTSGLPSTVPGFSLPKLAPSCANANPKKVMPVPEKKAQQLVCPNVTSQSSVTSYPVFDSKSQGISDIVCGERATRISLTYVTPVKGGYILSSPITIGRGEEGLASTLNNNISQIASNPQLPPRCQSGSHKASITNTAGSNSSTFGRNLVARRSLFGLQNQEDTGTCSNGVKDPVPVTSLATSDKTNTGFPTPIITSVFSLANGFPSTQRVNKKGICPQHMTKISGNATAKRTCDIPPIPTSIAEDTLGVMKCDWGSNVCLNQKFPQRLEVVNQIGETVVQPDMSCLPVNADELCKPRSSKRITIGGAEDGYNNEDTVSKYNRHHQGKDLKLSRGDNVPKAVPSKHGVPESRKSAGQTFPINSTVIRFVRQGPNGPTTINKIQKGELAVIRRTEQNALDSQHCSAVATCSSAEKTNIVKLGNADVHNSLHTDCDIADVTRLSNTEVQNSLHRDTGPRGFTTSSSATATSLGKSCGVVKSCENVRPSSSILARLLEDDEGPTTQKPHMVSKTVELSRHELDNNEDPIPNYIRERVTDLGRVSRVSSSGKRMCEGGSSGLVGNHDLNYDYLHPESLKSVHGSSLNHHELDENDDEKTLSLCSTPDCPYSISSESLCSDDELSLMGNELSTEPKLLSTWSKGDSYDHSHNEGESRENKRSFTDAFGSVDQLGPNIGMRRLQSETSSRSVAGGKYLETTLSKEAPSGVPSYICGSTVHSSIPSQNVDLVNDVIPVPHRLGKVETMFTEPDGHLVPQQHCSSNSYGSSKSGCDTFCQNSAPPTIIGQHSRSERSSIVSQVYSTSSGVLPVKELWGVSGGCGTVLNTCLGSKKQWSSQETGLPSEVRLRKLETRATSMTGSNADFVPELLSTSNSYASSKSGETWRLVKREHISQPKIDIVPAGIIVTTEPHTEYHFTYDTPVTPETQMNTTCGIINTSVKTEPEADHDEQHQCPEFKVVIKSEPNIADSPTNTNAAKINRHAETNVPFVCNVRVKSEPVEENDSVLPQAYVTTVMPTEDKRSRIPLGSRSSFINALETELGRECSPIKTKVKIYNLKQHVDYNENACPRENIVPVDYQKIQLRYVREKEMNKDNICNAHVERCNATSAIIPDVICPTEHRSIGPVLDEHKFLGPAIGEFKYIGPVIDEHGFISPDCVDPDSVRPVVFDHSFKRTAKERELKVQKLREQLRVMELNIEMARKGRSNSTW